MADGIPQRRDQGDRILSLPAFVRSLGGRPDRMAGFLAWAKLNDLKNKTLTLDEWQRVLARFRARAV